MLQPEATVHSLSPLASSTSLLVASGRATGREYAALLRGIDVASCGALYPACPRVCKGQALDPSSNISSEKSGGSRYSFWISSALNSRRRRFKFVIFPPKCCHLGEEGLA